VSSLVTLEQLRADARVYADRRTDDEDTDFFTAIELNRILNQQLADFYDLLVAARGHEYYADDATIAVIDGTAAYDLPDDFYQLLALNLEWGENDVEPMNALNNYQDIWLYKNSEGGWYKGTRKAYRLRAEQIDFYPTPTAAVTARVYYVPAFVPLVDDEDTFDGVNGWEKLVTLGAAIEMLEIEEVGSGARLQKLYDATRERIEGLAADRDAATPVEVRDVECRRWYRYPPATGTTQ
jgi:hypothetical protein